MATESIMNSSLTKLDIYRSDHVARVVIEGSNDLNALDQRTTDELAVATADLNEDESVRCIVLTGAGDAFGAGADLA